MSIKLNCSASCHKVPFPILNELLLSAGSIWEIGVAQAIVEQVSIVSVDANLDAFGVTRIW
jgi:PIN domain nuclease of toxin-antitoxin system